MRSSLTPGRCGGALAVRVERSTSFFPEIYNDGWFFLLDGDKGIQPVAISGRVVQYPYDPFRSPDRARAEEFGMYWLRAFTGCSTRTCRSLMPTRLTGDYS